MPREVLTQEEIDLLLKALASGEVQAEEAVRREDRQEAKPYDFRRPNKFSKEQLSTLFMIHDNFGRLVSNFLSGYLRTSVQVKIVSVDQVTYEDFLVSIPMPTLITVFSLAPLKGTAILETSSAFVFPILDLLLGGTGFMPQKARELTDIEIGVLRRVNARILEQLRYAWGDLVSFEPHIEFLETNPQFNQVLSPNETVAVITFTTQVGETQGLINLCWPYISLEAVVGRLTARYWFAAQEAEDEEASRQVLIQLLEEVPVELAVRVGSTRITLREFLDLQPGDAIALDRSVKEDLELLVEGRPYLYGQPGVVGKKLGLLLTGWAAEEDRANG
ncbi:MAG: flagellar motor switch protein FliM [Moorellales bacterium]